MTVVWARVVESRLAEWTEFADEPNMRHRKKRGVKHDTKVFILNKWNNRVAISRDKKKYQRCRFGKHIVNTRSSVPGISLRSSFDICAEVPTEWLDG